MAEDYIEVTDSPGFEINTPVVVGDMSDVQAEILPVCQNVVGEIRKASLAASKDGGLKFIKLELRIRDGIPTENGNGDIEYRYRGKTVFPGMLETLIWADPLTKTSNWYKQKQHLLSFKEFCKALGLEGSITVNDEFLQALVGRSILFSVKHEPNRVLNESGERVADGTFRERVYGWKRVAEE